MKFCQPSASQSKSTQTRPSSLGSRKTCEPLDPCCFRFSRLVVEKTFIQRSKSSTFDVARNTFPPLSEVSSRSYGMTYPRSACARQCGVGPHSSMPGDHTLILEFGPG